MNWMDDNGERHSFTRSRIGANDKQLNSHLTLHACSFFVEKKKRKDALQVLAEICAGYRDDKRDDDI